MLPSQQWEYCQVYVSSVESNREGYKVDMDVSYFGSRGGNYSLNKKIARPYNPFHAAISLLGEYGWEVVSVQYPDSSSGGGSIWIGGGKGIVAFLKRPVHPGRNTNEPQLVLS